MGIDVSRIGDHPIACKIFTSIRVMAEENSDDNVFSSSFESFLSSFQPGKQ